MGPVPFALSIHHFINSVGSDAGFASIIGLAILILLYFAQARETASLRNHAQEAADRIQQLEARLTQVSRAQPAPPAPPAAQAVAQGAPAVSRQAAAGAAPRSRTATPTPVSAIPGAPAGVGAPALTAATKLIPTPQVAAVAVADPVQAGAPTGPVAGAPAPATVAGGANGAGHAPSGTLPPAQTGAPRQTVPPRTQLRPPGTIPPSRRPPNSGGRPPQGSGNGTPSRGRKILAVLVALLAVAAIVVVLLIVTGGSSSNSSSNATSPASNAPRRHRAATFNTSQVTVAVLNGTSKANLAHDVGQKLVGGGYQEGTIATAQDQTHPSTIVAYLPGFKRDALAVAGTLKLKPAAVQAVDSSTQAVACPPPSTCQANVIVTVGSDLATTQ
jgi:hypothetical protein